jgi:hypothetical protein
LVEEKANKLLVEEKANEFAGALLLHGLLQYVNRIGKWGSAGDALAPISPKAVTTGTKSKQNDRGGQIVANHKFRDLISIFQLIYMVKIHIQ